MSKLTNLITETRILAEIVSRVGKFLPFVNKPLIENFCLSNIILNVLPGFKIVITDAEIIRSKMIKIQVVS